MDDNVVASSNKTFYYFLFIYLYFKQIPVELNFSLTKSPVNLVKNVLIVRLFCHNKQQVHLMRASSS